MNKQRLIILLTVILLFVIGTVAQMVKNMLSEHRESSGENNSLRNVQLRVDFIDVGKGDCILIRSEKHTLMIDTGYRDTADDVFDFLEGSDVSEIDALILTHYDKDHIGGAKKLISQYQVKKIYIPDYEKDEKKYKKLIKAIDKSDVNVDAVSDTVTFTADRITYTVMPSGAAYDPDKENDNDMSLLVTVRYANDSYLFTGDIEEEGINCFLEKNQSTFDVIKMPHHGKKEKNSKALLNNVKPKYAVITDDHDNPAESSLCKLLEGTGTSYYRTSQKGTVTITGNGSGEYTVKTKTNQ